MIHLPGFRLPHGQLPSTGPLVASTSTAGQFLSGLFRSGLFLSGLFLSGLLVADLILPGGTSVAQAQTAGGVGYKPVPTQKWEMGIEIQSPGSASGITAIFPVPIDWPEQKVKLLAENKSELVARIRTRFVDSKKNCKIAVVSIPKMTPQSVARATLVFEIKKSHITEPADTTPFRISRSAARSQRLFLGSSPFIETTHPRIKSVAEGIQFADQPAWQNVELVFDWVRDNIKYEFDEQIKTCLAALESREGDCEELSSIFIAICRAKGIPARAVWIPGHTYPEFYLEDQKGQGHWFPCQVAGGDHDFGRMPEDKPILQKGDRFKIPGHAKLQRYARPTLTARNASASPTLKWIMERKESE